MSEKVFDLNLMNSQFKSGQVPLVDAWRQSKTHFLDTRQYIICVSPDTLIFSFSFYSDTYKIKGLFSLAQDHAYFQKHPLLFQLLQFLLLGEIRARQLLFIFREFKRHP